MIETFDSITLGGGKIPVNTAPGIVEQVTGSRRVSHSPRGETDLWRLLKRDTTVIQLPAGHLWCSCCGELRPTSYFHEDASRQGRGYSYECVTCTRPKDAERKRRRRREIAAAEGREVRPYLRRAV